MAGVKDLLLTKTAQNFKNILASFDPSSKLRPHSTSSALVHSIKTFHDCIHDFDAVSSDQIISELVIEALDDEQVWQQQELQLGVAKRFISEQNVQNLVQLYLRFNNVSDSKETKTIDSLSDVDSLMDTEDSDSVYSIFSEDSDPEFDKIKKSLKDKEDMDSESVDELFKGTEEEWLEEAENSQPESSKHVNRKSVVDGKFFKLDDMEQFVNQELKKDGGEKSKIVDGNNSGSEEESGDETRNLVMFAEWSDEEAGKEAMYADFFDPPAEEEGDVQQATRKASGPAAEGGVEEENEASEMSDDNMGRMGLSDEEETFDSKKKVRFNRDIVSAKEEDKWQQPVSNFEKRRERVQQQIKINEDQSLEPKPWQMMGEVEARERPENSLLEQNLQFRQATPVAAEITEEVTTSIEEVLLQKIRSKAYDDNIRQVRPREEAFTLRTERTLDQEKSKLSLHEVYEQEFLKQQAPEEETCPQHEEIKKMINHLFPRLDALASWQYTPLQAIPEIKIKSNLPAVQMEEATPIAISDANLLAPEEIHEKKKGELKGKTETTKTDRLRQRKQKKAAKRQRRKDKEIWWREVEKMNPGVGNKYSKQRVLEQLEKEASGNIEVIKEKKSKESFFGQLEGVTRQEKISRTGKKKKAEKSSPKLLL